MMNASGPSLPGAPALCRFLTPDAEPHLGWWDGSAIIDLTRASGGAYTTVAQALASGSSLRMLASALAIDAPAYALGTVTLLAPLDLQEVWAAGVTYERSREARIAESDSAPDVYARVYEAERPELFYKGNARLTAGTEQPIRVRADSRWTVPEPELAVLVDGRARIAGYTIGNDVSARDIEGENPLYLPQAKVYAGACALGPWIVPAESVDDPYALRITCSISRGGAVLWQDETSTAQLHRRLDELTAYLTRAMSFPDGAYLLTGTSLVPPDSISLQTGDVVEVGIAGLGTLRNPVG
jgi:2-dehydro-3-deoxy-D-arabinonate dehydratase